MEAEAKTIQIACDVKDFLPIDHLEPFQGELKTLLKEDYERLKKEITKTGFSFPFYVWKDSGKFHLIGGHQRLRVLQTLRNEGWKVPAMPVVFVFADSYELAKRRVLQDASQYGTVEKQGLYEFMVETQIDPGDFAASFKIPDLDVPAFNAEYFLDDVKGGEENENQDTAASEDGAPGPADKTGSKELSENSFTDFQHKCPRCGFEFD